MGVAGCGKSTVGEALADRLGWTFVDADALHAPASIEAMRRGLPLTDDDRWPWLGRLGAALAPSSRIVGCSALRRVHRDAIRAGAGGPVAFVHLCVPKALIGSRLAARMGHFMPVALIDSQFATLEPLEPDERGIEVAADASLEPVLDAVMAGLGRVAEVS